ncbi:MAG: alpha,alpha-trehalose-phosphate synthase (UDP-forming) [Mesorhizobium sp.]|nr:alpha,alpha-trehalose-phosphate synthase (UDP-forming) [Mesorhizobium sp.]MCO5163040.1 alpha,alpha-trehalose-phosphate synthase (UDP-forming) [Mesorhizobium sp.]
MSRLVVVSNRVPAPSKSKVHAGGLAVALQAALNARGGLWMGWSGVSSGAREPGAMTIRQEGPITYALTDLSRKDIDEYYAGFANSTLWPLCHYRLDITDYARKDMAGYFRVNRFFARQLGPQLAADDVVWIHDYHLIPLAAELRRMGVKNRIGFFLHIPFPPPDVFFALPVYASILEGLVDYDVVGFQTRHDADNFAACIEREGIGHPREPGMIETRGGGRRVKVGVFPIGIDTRGFEKMATEAVANPAVRKIARSLRDREVVVGVDRLDYSKGIPQRMQAFERFLRDNPAYKGRATLLQVTPKSRSDVPHYLDMQREVAELAGRVNGELATLDWTPIRYVNSSINHSILAGLYRLAKVGLVTPMRDGMNLVAKEYIAAQDPADPGVLVLSRFAGAARELQSAILVNPYDTEAVSQAIAQALSLPLAARIERHAAMLRHLRRHDISAWCDAFLDALAATEERR